MSYQHEQAYLLAKGNPRAAAPFMSACVTITQLVMLLTAAYFGRSAHRHGRPVELPGAVAGELRAVDAGVEDVVAGRREGGIVALLRGTARVGRTISRRIRRRGLCIRKP